MTHETLKTFGYPQTLVHEYAHWCVLLRPGQVTLGSLVLVCKQDATQLADISAAAFAEMKQVVADIESGLKKFRPWNKINYLALMMVDPHVHFHVIPRYDHDQTFAGVTFRDAGWPGVPLLAEAIVPDVQVSGEILAQLKAGWGNV